MKPSRALWHPCAHKPFCVPHFLVLGNKTQPPWPSLNSKGQVQTVANQKREWMQRQGRSRQETIVQPRGRVPGPSPRNIGNSIFGFFCRTKTPNNWKMLRKPSSFWRDDLQITECQLWKQWKIASNLILIWGPIFHSPNYKTTYQSSWGGHSL